jgi:anti-sigma B factor antagonist
MALRFAVSAVGDVTILKLDGRIVLGVESKELRARIKSLLGENRRKILLNLNDVTFVDSAGNGVMVAIHHSALSSGALLKLCHLSRKLQEGWQISKLLTVFDVYSTEADALKSFEFPPVYCLCPICGARCGPSLLRGSRWAQQSCNDPGCSAQFTVRISQTPEDFASITKLTFQTYEKEFFEIDPGVPFTCRIWGRLDLFSSSALQKCWLALPSPRRVVFDMHRATEINEAGRTALMTLLAGKGDGSKVTISLDGLNREQVAAFPDAAPFYQHMTDALNALGDVSDTPRWLARISEESQLSL